MTIANRGNKTNFDKEPADENKLNFCLAHLFAYLICSFNLAVNIGAFYLFGKFAPAWQ